MKRIITAIIILACLLSTALAQENPVKKFTINQFETAFESAYEGIYGSKETLNDKEIFTDTDGRKVLVYLNWYSSILAITYPDSEQVEVIGYYAGWPEILWDDLGAIVGGICGAVSVEYEESKMEQIYEAIYNVSKNYDTYKDKVVKSSYYLFSRTMKTQVDPGFNVYCIIFISNDSWLSMVSAKELLGEKWMKSGE